MVADAMVVQHSLARLEPVTKLIEVQLPCLWLRIKDVERGVDKLRAGRQTFRLPVGRRDVLACLLANQRCDLSRG